MQVQISYRHVYGTNRLSLVQQQLTKDAKNIVGDDTLSKTRPFAKVEHWTPNEGGDKEASENNGHGNTQHFVNKQLWLDHPILDSSFVEA